MQGNVAYENNTSCAIDWPKQACLGLHTQPLYPCVDYLANVKN